jgi:hypothetical protein
VCTGLIAQPAAAQESPLAGTPAQGTNPDSPSSPPDLVTIVAGGCTVEEGASVTLEDGDGTQARFVDGQLGIEITSTSRQITIEGPNDDYIGDHAVSESDPGFDSDGDYTVSTTTGIACEELDGNASTGGGETNAADDQYTTGDTTPTAKGGVISHKKINNIPKQKGIPTNKKIIGIPKQKVLVNTGGPPLLLLGAALMCLAGAGLAVQLLRVLRR